MNAFIAFGLAGACIVTASEGQAATIVDWLGFQSGNAGQFSMVNDDGTQVVSGRFTVSGGLAFPGLPATKVLNGSFWETDPDFEDSESGDATVQGVEFRVFPINGQASYTIELSVPSGVSLIFAVGELLRDESSATTGVDISAASSSGESPVVFQGANAWVSEFQRMDQDLVWDPVSGVLSPALTANGQSQVAFFSAAPIAGSDAKIRFTIPEAYGAGVGDSLTVAVGIVGIPEPVTLMLTSFGTILLLGRRR